MSDSTHTDDLQYVKIGPTGRTRKIRKPTWHRGHYSYLESSGVESSPLPCIVNGPWAIGRWHGLTHLPSGLRVGTFATRAGAKTAAARLSALPVDWTQNKPDYADAREQMRSIVIEEGSIG